MKGDVKLPFWPDRRAIDLDPVVERVDFCAECADDLTVYGDAPGKNNTLGGPPGGNAGFGEEFLEADHGAAGWVGGWRFGPPEGIKGD
jgi:hypothetical protein